MCQALLRECSSEQTRHGSFSPEANRLVGEPDIKPRTPWLGFRNGVGVCLKGKKHGFICSKQRSQALPGEVKKSVPEEMVPSDDE